MEKAENKVNNKGINITGIFQLIWEKRRLFVRNGIIAGVFGLIYVFSLPKTYTSQVMLVPEGLDTEGLSGAVSSLASLSGFDLNKSTSDAIYPNLYPIVVTSTSFLVELFKVQVCSEDQEISTNLYDYMHKHQKIAWWSYIGGFPSRVLKWIRGEKKRPNLQLNIGKTDSYYLSKEQTDVATMISSSINCVVDKKTQAITLSVEAQDPIIATALTDTVRVHLQDFIIRYRTHKANADLAYAEKLFDETKKTYERSQVAWANFSDKNQNIVSVRYKTEMERLKNQMNLDYNVYTQAAQQMQLSKAKVQEKRPVYSVIQPAVVPIKASSPKKLVILCVFLLLTCIITFTYLVVKTLQEDESRIIIKP